MDFARELAKRRGINAPTEIPIGNTVQVLNELKGNTMWKKPLARKIIEEMPEAQIEPELRGKITQIYKSVR